MQDETRQLKPCHVNVTPYRIILSTKCFNGTYKQIIQLGQSTFNYSSNHDLIQYLIMANVN